MCEPVLGIEGELLDSANQRVVNLAVVGCGSHAFRNIFPCFQFLPVRLLAVCDLNGEKAKAYQKKFGATYWCTDFQELLSDPDLEGVVLVLGYGDDGAPLYPEVASRFLERGFPVWMEKPPASTADEVRVMESAMKRGRTFLQVGFKKMFMPSYTKAKEIIESPNFGDLSSYLMRYPVDLPKHAGDLRLAANRRFIDDFVHVASAIVYFAGRPQKVSRYRAANGGGFAVFEHPNGIQGVVHFAKGSSDVAPLEFVELVGNGEHVTIDNCIVLRHFRRGFLGPYGRKDTYFPVQGCTEVFWPEFSLGQLYNKGLFLEGYYHELKEFVDSIIEKRHPSRGGVSDALSVMEIIDAFSTHHERDVVIGTKPSPLQVDLPPRLDAYKCRNCGGNLVLKDGWNYKCKSCGASVSHYEIEGDR